MKLTEDSKNVIIMSESHIVAKRLSLSAQLSLQNWYCQKYCLVARGETDPKSYCKVTPRSYIQFSLMTA